MGRTSSGTQTPEVFGGGGAKDGAAFRLPHSQKRWVVLLVCPTLVVLAVVIVYPIIHALIMSFQSDTSLETGGAYFTEKSHFVWLQNYFDWLFQRVQGQDAGPGTSQGIFWRAFANTFLFAAFTVTCETILSLWIATVLTRNFRGRGLVRAAVLVPWAIPTALTAKLWFMIFSAAGIANAFLTEVLSVEAVDWLQGGWPSFFAVVIADIWKTTPFMALLILAGLQTIPRDVYEASRVDGASSWQCFAFITLPLVKPALMVAILFRLLDALRIFDLPYILANKESTKTLSILVAEQIRTGSNSAAALSTMIFIMIFLVALVFIRFLEARAVTGADTLGKRRNRILRSTPYDYGIKDGKGIRK